MFTYSEIQNFKTPLAELWDPGVERCGIITATGEIQEKRNRASDPTRFFEFDIKDLEGAVATWHTHPQSTANLSIDDYRFFQSWPELTHFIVSLTDVRCYLTSKGLVHLVDEEKDHPSRISS